MEDREFLDTMVNNLIDEIYNNPSPVEKLLKEDTNVLYNKT